MTYTDEILGTVPVSNGALARIRRDGPWVILYVKDGGGAQATLSLTVSQALSVAELLCGSAITASGLKR